MVMMIEEKKEGIEKKIVYVVGEMIKEIKRKGV